MSQRTTSNRAVINAIADNAAQLFNQPATPAASQSTPSQPKPKPCDDEFVYIKKSALAELHKHFEGYHDRFGSLHTLFNQILQLANLPHTAAELIDLGLFMTKRSQQDTEYSADALDALLSAPTADDYPVFAARPQDEPQEKAKAQTVAPSDGNFKGEIVVNRLWLADLAGALHFCSDRLADINATADCITAANDKNSHSADRAHHSRHLASMIKHTADYQVDVMFSYGDEIYQKLGVPTKAAQLVAKHRNQCKQ